MIINKITEALVWTKCLKGRRLNDGRLETRGLNKWHPLAWVIFIVGSLAVVIEMSFKGIALCWKDWWA